MEVLTALGSLFFSVLDTVTAGAYWLVLLLIGAWLAAVVFNVIHEVSGGR